MEIVITGTLAFVATNIDDLFLLTLFFSNPGYQTSKIIIGQFAGIISLIAISVAGSMIGYLISPAYIGLMGVFPIYLGLRQLISLIRNNGVEDDNDADSNLTQRSIILSVAMVTIANGGDNVAIYIPLFVTLTSIGKMIIIVVFLGMTSLWCAAGKYLANHPLLKKSIGKYGHIITPVVLILLGVFILYESNTLSLIHVFSHEATNP